MRAALRRLRLAPLLLALAACETPPASVFIDRSVDAVVGEAAGSNARGETCTVVPFAAPPLDAPVLRSREIFCGGWTQPAARVVELAGGDTSPEALLRLANGGLWRSALAERLACEPAEALGGATPGALLRCVRRRGGWPQVAVVMAQPGGPVLVDGLAASLPVVERLLASGPAGGATASTAGAARSQAMQAAVSRLAGRAYGAADVSRYEQLMALGRDLNQAENFAASEEAYRAALSIQQRVVGADNANTVGPLLNLALSLSNQGRFPQAKALFAQAAALAPQAADPAAGARLLHYRGLDALNQGDTDATLPLLDQAEAAYARTAPAAFVSLNRAFADQAMAEALTFDSLAQSALLGVAEVRRYRGIALARLGQTEAGLEQLRSARNLLRAAGLESGLLVGRSLRSQGSLMEDDDRQDLAARLLTASAARFSEAMPGERPEAMTLFLAGGRQLRIGQRAAALASFRSAERLLRMHQAGLPVAVVLPYLDALAAEAAANPDKAAALQVEMFEAVQSTRREVTSRLVEQAAARLSAAGGNSRVAAAVRRMQDADRDVRALLTERDMGARGGTAAMDARIAAAQATRNEAEAEVLAAAPGYRQLLQATVAAPATAAVLQPKEVLVSMVVGRDHGHVFALRANGQVLAARLDLGEAAIAALVARVRRGVTVDNSGTPPAFDQAAAAALYAAVLGPLAPALAEAESLLVVADGPLLSIPFGLLLTGPASPDNLAAAPWLLRRYAVVHVPSAQTVVTLRGSRGGGASAAANPYIGFGDPVSPSQAQLQRAFPPASCSDDARLASLLQPLPGARAELLAARDLTRAGPSAVKLGAEFTQAALTSARLEDYRVLHLATHARLPGELSCLSEPALLVSAPRGGAEPLAAFMPASAFAQLKLDADLVILSACNTGATTPGDSAAGEGLSALARAAFFAGARGVLATHWAMDDSAASLTIADTLRRQGQEGTTSAAALRGAQLLLLEEAGRQLPAAWAHPYYWAAFALLGDGRRADPRS